MRLKMLESDLKRQVKDFLAYKGIFNFPLTQGLGAYRGAPDRIMHLSQRVVYLEIKLPKGVMSVAQLTFQEQCQRDGIEYRVIRSLDDLEKAISEAVTMHGAAPGRARAGKA